MELLFGAGSYGWWQRWQQEGGDLKASLGEALDQVKSAGLACWEPTLESHEETVRTSDMLRNRGLAMPSFYANARLHDGDVKSAIQEVLNRAEWGHEAGAEIAVVNPEPVQWGEPVDKSETQLRTQAAALEELGGRLRERGIRLAYHTHDMEMRNNAHELHTTLQSVSSENLGFCLDAHWVYRGAGNSRTTLEQITEQYRDRILCLHLRQSINGIWSETIDEGDINYRAVFEKLSVNENPLLATLEIAYEPGTPKTMSIGEAHSRSIKWLKSLWAG